MDNDRKNKTMIKYYESKKIFSLILNDNKGKEFSNSETQRMYNFIYSLVDYENSFILNDNDILNSILDKLEPLDSLYSIRIEQIRDSLTNCGYFYDSDSKPILEFYNNILTYDFNEKKRDIHNKFIKILLDVDKSKNAPPVLVSIFRILSKANIKGIIIGENEYLPFEEYLKDSKNETIKKLINFEFNDKTKKINELDYLFSEAFRYYQLEDYENAYSFTKQTINYCNKYKIIAIKFIAMFNNNLLLRKLKGLFSKSRDKYKNKKGYNLKEEFNRLPNYQKRVVEPIYSFTGFEFFYKDYYTISKKYRKKEEIKEIIENGGSVWGGETSESSVLHHNFINYILKNKIMIEEYLELKDVSEKYVRIAIIKQFQHQVIKLSQIELLTCIKYIESKILLEIFHDFYNIDITKTLIIDNSEKEWLINIALKNIIELLKTTNRELKNFENYTINILFLLSISKLEEEFSNKLYDMFFDIIEFGKNTLGIYNSINLFLYRQYSLYETIIPKEINIKFIEHILNKFITGIMNGYEYHSIISNNISSFYYLAKENGVNFNNKELMSKFIEVIKGYKTDQQIKISYSVILSIYEISSDVIKSMSDDYLKSLLSKSEIKNENYLSFRIRLVTYKIEKVSQTLIDDLEKYISKFNGNYFSYLLYTLKYEVDSLLSTGIRKYRNEFKNLHERMAKEIERYESRERNNYSI